MWFNPKTGAIARTNIEARMLCPGWSAPLDPSDEQIKSQGFALVTRTAPEFDPIYQEATEILPKLINGVWTQQWQITARSHDIIASGLAEAIKVKVLEIDAARLSANFGTFTYNGDTFSCDALSRSDLDATAGYVGLFGAFAPDFPNAWKKADGTYIPMPTVDEFKAFYRAFYDQGLANLKQSETLKQALAKATTAADIAAIQWSPA